MLPNRVNLLPLRIDMNPLERRVPTQKIPKERQSHHMVQMRVRQKDRDRLGRDEPMQAKQ